MSGAHGVPIWLRLFHRLDPETAHALTLKLVHLVPPRRWRAPEALRVRLGPLLLEHPVGLAAGFDKDAVAVGALARLGFSFVEVGTVTPRPQAGNPHPRIFRLHEDEAVINRMGFPSAGADVVARRLARWRARGVPAVVGGNIGINRDSTDPVADFREVYRRIAPHVDYVCVNVSSPNTPGLRELQRPEHLGRILEALREEADRSACARPLFVKLAPDLSRAEVAAAVETAVAHGVRGLVVGNTTLQRPAGLRSALRGEAGGLSGRPLAPLAREKLRETAEAARGRLSLVACGGIFDAEEAWRRVRLGSSALQLYTALVYRGPAVIREIVEDLAARLAQSGAKSLAEVVGAELAAAQPRVTSS